MTHDAGPGIDPRFDARFQRGYDGTSPPDVASDPPQAAPQSEVTVPDAPVEDAAPAIDRPVAELSAGVVESTEATNSTVAGSRVAGPAPTPPEPLEPAEPLKPAEPLEPTPFGATARLWIALAVSVAFMVVGTGVLWALVSDSDYFMGRVGSASEQAVMQFMMTLAPGFVQAGVVGLVVVLVAWAVRARRAAPHGPDGRSHR